MNITSNNQSGGTTAHTVNNFGKSNNPKKDRAKKIVGLIVGIVTFVAASLAILSYFGVEINKEDLMSINITSNNQSGGITAHTININGIWQRQLTSDLEQYILATLQEYKASGAAIHYEQSGETEQFVGQIGQFLVANGFETNRIAHTMSGMSRGAFLIEPPKNNLGWAYIRIGSLN